MAAFLFLLCVVIVATWLFINRKQLWARRSADAFCTLFLVMVLIGLILPVAQNARDLPPVAIRCRENLQRIGAALRQYHNDYGSFPPALVVDEQGLPLHSWRTLILPYLDVEPRANRFHRDLHDRYRFDEPWNGPKNSAISAHPVEVFRCFFDRAGKNATASYFAVVGADTAWPVGRTSKLESDFSDGAGNTILLVEMADADIGWSEPRDLRFENQSFQIDGPSRESVSSRHRVVNVLFADGRVESLRLDTPPEVIRAMLTANGGEQISFPVGAY